MKNAVLLAHKFISCFPESEMPENTDSYEGYYHVSDIRGDVSQCIMTYHIRDFSAARYEERKKTSCQNCLISESSLWRRYF